MELYLGSLSPVVLQRPVPRLCAVGPGVNVFTLSARGTYSSRRNVFSVHFLDDSKDEQNSFLESA